MNRLKTQPSFMIEIMKLTKENIEVLKRLKLLKMQEIVNQNVVITLLLVNFGV